MVIYTLGHSNYSFDKLLDMIKMYDINCVVDIRAIPYSKYNTQFDKEVMALSLKEKKIFYIYMGEEFGAKREDKSTYNKDGYCDFDKLIKEELFLKGISRLIDGIKKGYRIVLLGAMQNPIRCPRSVLLGKYLDSVGVEVRHIMHSGEILSQRDMESMMVEKYFPDRNQITIGELLGEKISDDEYIEMSYKLANREIGYRLEHIKN